MLHLEVNVTLRRNASISILKVYDTIPLSTPAVVSKKTLSYTHAFYFLPFTHKHNTFQLTLLKHKCKNKITSLLKPQVFSSSGSKSPQLYNSQSKECLDLPLKSWEGTKVSYCRVCFSVLFSLCLISPGSIQFD